MNSNGTATTRGRSLVLVTAVTSVLGWGHLSAEEAVAAEAVDPTEFKSLVVSLESLVEALGRNLDRSGCHDRCGSGALFAQLRRHAGFRGDEPVPSQF